MIYFIIHVYCHLESEDVVAEFRNPLQALRSHEYSPTGNFIKKLSADHSVRIFVPHFRERDALMTLEGEITNVYRFLYVIS